MNTVECYIIVFKKKNPSLQTAVVQNWIKYLKNTFMFYLCPLHFESVWCLPAFPNTKRDNNDPPQEPVRLILNTRLDEPPQYSTSKY
jgi:hypothetical protein